MSVAIKEIMPNELYALKKAQPGALRVIDVREFSEMASGVIPGAEPMPLATVPLRLSELAQDEQLVFVCRSGARSAQACVFLQQRGYEQVYNLSGGIMGWVSSGLPRVQSRAI